jgi:hypothetical protein
VLFLVAGSAQGAELLRVSGLKTYRTTAISSSDNLDLVQFAPTKIPGLSAKVKCRAGGKRCIIKIAIEASLEGLDNSIVEICPLIDGSPLTKACRSSGELSPSGVKLTTLVFTSRKPGSSHTISFRVFSTSTSTTLRAFNAEYTSLYK